MTHTVVGLFDDRSEAQRAMQDLVAAGFVQEDIDLSNRSFADGGGHGASKFETSASVSDAGESIGDRISNFFSSLFGDDEVTATNYTNAATEADAILTVHVDSDERARKAQEILDSHNAIDVDGRSSRFADDGGVTNANLRTSGADSGLKDRQTIPVVEENLNVDKREVERGGARIRSRVVEKPVEATVRLREEHVVVNRRPVDREVNDADRKNFQPGEMELTERAEIPIVGKEARVVEEVEVGKNVTERDETVRDTVRRTEVDVDEFDNENEVANLKSKKANP